jgi:hypothetical protein
MGIIIISVSPLRLAILRPLLVRVCITESTTPSNTTSLSTLHHHAGRPVLVHARTELLVKSPGPGRMQPVREGWGGTKACVFSFSTDAVFFDDVDRRCLRSWVGERSAALTCVVESRMREKRFSSSDCGLAALDVIVLRFSSVGR